MCTGPLQLQGISTLVLLIKAGTDVVHLLDFQYHFHAGTQIHHSLHRLRCGECSLDNPLIECFTSTVGLLLLQNMLVRYQFLHSIKANYVLMPRCNVQIGYRKAVLLLCAQYAWRVMQSVTSMYVYINIIMSSVWNLASQKSPHSAFLSRLDVVNVIIDCCFTQGHAFFLCSYMYLWALLGSWGSGFRN